MRAVSRPGTSLNVSLVSVINTESGWSDLWAFWKTGAFIFKLWVVSGFFWFQANLRWLMLLTIGVQVWIKSKKTKQILLKHDLLWHAIVLLKRRIIVQLPSPTQWSHWNKAALVQSSALSSFFVVLLSAEGLLFWWWYFRVLISEQSELCLNLPATNRFQPIG